MKQLVKATLMFIMSLTLFTAVVYAWFTNSNESNIQPVSAHMIERNLDMDVEFGINGGGSQNFVSAMQAGDLINIRVVIQNANSLSSPDMDLSIMLYNIRSTETDEDYDLTDFFYLENGTIDLTWYLSLTDYYADNIDSTQSVMIDTIDDTSIEYIGIPLENSRLSNMFNHYMDGETLVVENNISILETLLPSQNIIVVEFSIGLDAYTPDRGAGFQNGELLIDGLYTLFDQE